MRKILIFLLLIIASKSFSQDVIIKNDKTELKVKVIEILPDMVKFKYADRTDGPLYSIYKKDIFMIIYEDGKREIFNEKPMGKMEENTTQTPLTGNENPTATLSDKETEKKSCLLMRIGTAETFDMLDAELDFRYKLGKKKNFSIGIGFNTTVYFESKETGYYGYATAAYRLWLSSKKQYPLSLWMNIGYAETLWDGAVIASGALWEVGTDIGLGKKGNFGLTTYSPKLESLFLGIYFNL